MEREIQGKNLLFHVALGSLPEQEFWERKVKGYDSRKGVNASAIAEMIACGIFVLTVQDYAIFGVMDAVVAGTRINMPVPRRGLYALEIPYEALKLIGQAAFSNFQRNNYPQRKS